MVEAACSQAISQGTIQSEVIINLIARAANPPPIEPATPAEIKERSTMIEQENVRLQIEHLKTYPLVRDAIHTKSIQVHGLYYDLDTGLLTKIV